MYEAVDEEDIRARLCISGMGSLRGRRDNSGEEVWIGLQRAGMLVATVFCRHGGRRGERT